MRKKWRKSAIKGLNWAQDLTNFAPK